jgi:hypothetical protein
LGITTLNAGASCSATLEHVTTSVECTGGIHQYPTYSCTFSCDTSGNLTRSSGAPCEVGAALCRNLAEVDGGASSSNCPPY